MAGHLDWKSKTSGDYIPTALHPLIIGVQSYYGSNKYAELVIGCQDREWKVHKAYVCPQFEFFDSAVEHFKEGQESLVNLKEGDPKVIDGLVHYLYNFGYNDQNGVPPIVLDVRMFIIADQFFVEPSKTLAAKKFEQNCGTEWATPAFAAAATEVYCFSLYDSSLEQMIVSTVKNHASILLDPKRSEEFGELHQVLRETELGIDIAMALAGSVEGKTYRCPECNVAFTVATNHDCYFTCPNRCAGKSSYSLEFWSRHVSDTA